MSLALIRGLNLNLTRSARLWEVLVGSKRGISVQNKVSLVFKRVNKEEAIKKAMEARSYLTDQFDCVYQFKFITQLRFMNRLKVYQTFISVGFGVSSIILYDMGYVKEIESMILLNGAMVFALVMMIILSRQTVRVVGRMYLSKDQNTVMISHLNFWGKRRDFQVKLDDVEAIASLGELNETLMNLKLRNMDGSMLLSVPYGKNIQQDGLFKILKIKKD